FSHRHALYVLLFLLLLTPRPPISPLFPYTTLFRSRRQSRNSGARRRSARARGCRRRQRELAAAYRSRAHSQARRVRASSGARDRSEEHTSELQSPDHLVCRLLLEKKKKQKQTTRES